MIAERVPADAELNAEQLRAVLAHFRKSRQLLGESRQRYLDRVSNDQPGIVRHVLRRLARDDLQRKLSRLGEYELIEEIGRGGVGVVYLGRQIGSHRDLAIKVLPSLGTSLGEQKRILQAYDSVSRLEHPAIVPLLHVGIIDGHVILVMPRIQGADLAKHLSSGPLEGRQSAIWARSIASALAYTHGQHVIHRDIKPANILIDQREQVHICDFDLAKVLDATQQLTRTGDVLGTPSYMSPEQARGEKANELSDIYSVGVVLYEMLTGRPPFRSPHRDRTLWEVCNQDPVPPRRLNSEVPEPLETICLKCLEKAPPNRYGSADELADDLDRWLNGTRIHARPPGWLARLVRLSKNHPTAVASLTAGLLLAAVAVFALFTHRGRLLAESQTRAARLENQVELEKRLAAEERARQSEFVAALDAAKIESSVAQPGWTERGLQHLKKACQLRSDDQRVPELRSVAARCLAGPDVLPRWDTVPEHEPFCLQYSPDGRQLAIGRHDGIGESTVYIHDAETGRQLRVLRCVADHSSGNFGVHALAFSPTGEWLAAGLHNGGICVWNNQTGQSHYWVAHSRRTRDLSFSFDNLMLASCSEDRTCKLWNVGSWEPITSVTEKEPCNLVDFSPDSDRLVISTIEGLQTYDVASLLRDDPHLIDQRTGSHEAHAMSPHGKLVATSFGTLIRLFSENEPDAAVVTCVDPTLVNKSCEDEVRQLTFNSDGTLLISASSDQTVKLWDTSTGRLQMTIRGSGADHAHAVFRPGSEDLAVLLNRKVAVYQITGGEVNDRFALHSQPIQTLAANDDKTRIACIAYSFQPTNLEGTGAVTQWDAQKGICLRSNDLPPGIHGAAHETVAMSYRSTSQEITYVIRGHSQFRGEKLAVMPVYPPRYVSLAFSADDRILWAAVDKELHAIDTTSGKPISSWRNSNLEAANGPTSLTALARLDESIAVASLDGSVKLFQPRAPFGLSTTWKVGSPIYCLAASEDEKTIAAGTLDGTVQLRDRSSGQILANVAAHGSRVTCVAFASNLDNVLATGAIDGSLCLWRFTRGKLQRLMTLSEQSSSRPARGLVFLDDGDRLVVLHQNDLSLSVWRIDRLRQSFQELDLEW